MDRLKYQCKSCGYSFTRKTEHKFIKCPYCGKEGTVELHKGNYAGRLLDEVSGD